MRVSRFTLPAPLSSREGKREAERPFILDNDVTDERKVYLQDILSNPKDNFIYDYDFGDGWEHKIVLEKNLLLDFSESPVVIKRKKACPPEDCGGIWGCADFLDAIQDPKHDEHESMIEWIGEEFDPDEFDMNFTNKYAGAAYLIRSGWLFAVHISNKLA